VSSKIHRIRYNQGNAMASSGVLAHDLLC